MKKRFVTIPLKDVSTNENIIGITKVGVIESVRKQLGLQFIFNSRALYKLTNNFLGLLPRTWQAHPTSNIRNAALEMTRKSLQDLEILYRGTMLVYTDIISNDEVLSDSFPYETLNDGVVFAVECDMVNATDNEQYNTGSNPSQEGDEEEDAGNANAEQGEQILNVVKVFSLNETSYDKKSYMSYIKSYMSTLKEILQKKNPTRVDAFMKGASQFVKDVLGDFDNYSFYCGPSYNPEAMVILYKEVEVDSGSNGKKTKHVMYFFKDGLKGEKC